uniref:Uncharacterized protein n=1 Tax=Arundo donax TaxID=35708 RepID=A0A0A9FF47_ARUDO
MNKFRISIGLLLWLNFLAFVFTLLQITD